MKRRSRTMPNVWERLKQKIEQNQEKATLDQSLADLATENMSLAVELMRKIDKQEKRQKSLMNGDKKAREGRSHDG